MKRLCIITNSMGGGGAEKVIELLSSEFNSYEDIELEIISLEKNDFFEVPKNIPIHYLSNMKGHENGLLKILLLPFFAFKLAKVIKRQKYHSVISHLYRANYVAILSKIFGTTTPISITNHGVELFRNSNGISNKINRFLVKVLYPKANNIIAVSEGMKQEMQLFSQSLKDISVIYNPVNTQNLSSYSSQKSPIDSSYFCCISRLIPLKRHNDLLKAAQPFFKTNPTWKLLIIGEGPCFKDLKEQANKLEINDNVIFTGAVTNPFYYFTHAKFSVLCSESEGFGNVLAESLACGTPCLATDCPSGPREILQPSSNPIQHLDFNDLLEETPFGYLSPVHNIQQLTKGLEEIKNRAFKKEDLKQRAFPLKKCAEAYRQVSGI